MRLFSVPAICLIVAIVVCIVASGILPTPLVVSATVQHTNVKMKHMEELLRSVKKGDLLVTTDMPKEKFSPPDKMSKVERVEGFYHGLMGDTIGVSAVDGGNNNNEGNKSVELYLEYYKAGNLVHIIPAKNVSDFYLRVTGAADATALK